MPLTLANRVKETSSTSGSGVITLAGASDGYQAFSSVLSSGDTTYYTITNSNNWEVGIGTYGSNTLSRDTILSSSNSGSRISLSNSSNVFIAYPSEKSVYKDASDQVVVGSSGVIISSGIPSNTDNVLYNVSGTLYFNGSAVDTSANFLSDIVEDTTPQLGGNLDLNNSSITGVGNVNIAGTVTADSGVYNNISVTGTLYSPNIGTDTDNSVVILNSAGYLKTDEIDSRVWGNTLADDSDIVAVSGLTVKSYQNITSDTTLTIQDDYIFVDSTSGDVTIDMPIASGNGGKEITIKRTAGDNSVILNASGLGNIDGSVNYTMHHLYQSTTLVSNNSSWFIT